MIKLSEIVSNLETKKSAILADDRFIGDIEFLEEGDLQDYTLIPLSLERGEGFLGFDTELNPYLIKLNKKIFNGEEQLSISCRQLTLQGLNWCSKYIVELNENRQELLNEVFNRYLKDNGLDADCQELGELSILNTMFDVYILSFETSELKYWITFRKEGDFWWLKKITKKSLGIKVKPKKGLNLNIV